jgi:hypothetical protein
VGIARIWRRLETLMELIVVLALLKVKQRAESLERVEVLAARLALGR